ncbi:MAG: HIT domain-containing protein [Chloroflexi bacterium]|nr:MAG: HIT domain-containing protein [Chloroflexota bacterium]
MTFERLYTPWRMKYIISNEQKKGCVFCDKLQQDASHDRENLVVYRAEETFVLMNLFPYNVGHLMILPRRHCAHLTDMPRETQFEMMLLTTYFTEILAAILNPEGFNVGINVGKAAGAGIDSHLHLHIVPRWEGDSNFMPVLGQTRVLPEELEITYDKILAEMKNHPPPTL